jgi:hypothetical protein
MLKILHELLPVVYTPMALLFSRARVGVHFQILFNTLKRIIKASSLPNGGPKRYEPVLSRFADDMYSFLHESAVNDDHSVEDTLSWLVSLLAFARDETIDLAPLLAPLNEATYSLLVQEVDQLVAFYKYRALLKEARCEAEAADCEASESTCGGEEEDGDVINDSKNGELGTRNESKATLNESKGTRNESKGTRNESKGTRNESKGTRNESKGTPNESKGTRNEKSKSAKKVKSKKSKQDRKTQKEPTHTRKPEEVPGSCATTTATATATTTTTTLTTASTTMATVMATTIMTTTATTTSTTSTSTDESPASLTEVLRPTLTVMPLLVDDFITIVQSHLSQQHCDASSGIEKGTDARPISPTDTVLSPDEPASNSSDHTAGLPSA